MARSVVTITVTEPADSSGKPQFVAEWVQDGKARGQYFRAVLAEQIRGWRAGGYRVIVKNPHNYATT